MEKDRIKKMGEASYEAFSRAKMIMESKLKGKNRFAQNEYDRIMEENGFTLHDRLSIPYGYWELFDND